MARDRQAEGTGRGEALAESAIKALDLIHKARDGRRAAADAAADPGRRRLLSELMGSPVRPSSLSGRRSTPTTRSGKPRRTMRRGSHSATTRYIAASSRLAAPSRNHQGTRIQVPRR
jgi:hypothetical protein